MQIGKISFSLCILTEIRENHIKKKETFKHQLKATTKTIALRNKLPKCVSDHSAATWTGNPHLFRLCLNSPVTRGRTSITSPGVSQWPAHTCNQGNKEAVSAPLYKTKRTWQVPLF